MSPDGSPASKKSKKQSNTAPIDSLSEDLLLEIFLRLPSLATLVRAALTCRAWRRAVASCPVFRRRFRELHRAPPLLGVFGDPQHVALPVFAPAHDRDRDVLAAVRGGDFALTSLLEPHADADDVSLRWRLRDCRDGRLLLMNWEAELLAIVNPLSRHRPVFIHMPCTETTEGRRGQTVFVDVHLLSSSSDDPKSFRLVRLSTDESGVRASVFSSATWDWSVHPWVEVAERAQQPRDNDQCCWLNNRHGTQANGFIYWVFKNRDHVLMLDTATMNFSVLEVPERFRFSPGLRLDLVVTRKDEAPCVVFCYGLIVAVLVCRVDEGGVQRWRGTAVRYRGDADPPENNDLLKKIMAVIDGFVYLETSKMVLSLCLETMKLEKLFPRSLCTDFCIPYTMGWPPSIAGNYNSFARIQDGTSNV